MSAVYTKLSDEKKSAKDDLYCLRLGFLLTNDVCCALFIRAALCAIVIILSIYFSDQSAVAYLLRLSMLGLVIFCSNDNNEKQLLYIIVCTLMWTVGEYVYNSNTIKVPRHSEMQQALENYTSDALNNNAAKKSTSEVKALKIEMMKKDIELLQSKMKRK